MTVENVNKSDVLIRSNVIGEQTEKNFLKILETGKADPNAADIYSQNYCLLQNLYKEYCSIDVGAALKSVVPSMLRGRGADISITVCIWGRYFDTVTICPSSYSVTRIDPSGIMRVNVSLG